MSYKGCDDMKYVKWYHVLVFTLLFLIFMIFILPEESNKSLTYGITESPDTSIFYTSDTLYRLADEYGESGREFYVTQRFTFDLIWPIVYGLFLLSTIGFLTYKINDPKYKYFVYMPVVSVIFDYLENITTSITMHRYPMLTPFISDMAGFMTLFKWSMLSLSMIALIFLLSIYLYNALKIKRRKVTL
jgi:hypothetical protein